MSLSKTCIARLVRQSLRHGCLQGHGEGMPTREYFCPLNPDRGVISHRITLAYHVIQPPKRADVERRFAEHFDPDSEECEYVQHAGNDPAEAERRAARR